MSFNLRHLQSNDIQSGKHRNMNKLQLFTRYYITKIERGMDKREK
jgi:hypothetical protein